MAIDCSSTTFTPIGERCYEKNGFAQAKTLLPCKSGVEFATASAAATESNWLAYQASEDIIPIQGILEVENQSTDNLVYQSPTGEKVYNGDGVRGFAVRILTDLKTHQILRGYSGKIKYMFVGDRQNNLKGTSPDGTKFRPFALNYFQVMPMGEPVGADTLAWTTIEVQFADTNEWDTDGVYIESPDWLISQMKGVGRVVVTQVGSIAANAYVVDVAYKDTSRWNGQASGAVFTSAISGLDENNFVSLDGTGASVAITGVVEDTSVPGRYTVSHSAFTAGSTRVDATATNLFASVLTALT